MRFLSLVVEHLKEVYVFHSPLHGGVVFLCFNTCIIP
jgi:hypothetical protein